MKQRGRQADRDVGGCHLVFVHTGHHVSQEEQQRPQRLPVLIREQQDGCLSCQQLLIFGKICWEEAGDGSDGCGILNGDEKVVLRDE